MRPAIAQGFENLLQMALAMVMPRMPPCPSLKPYLSSAPAATLCLDFQDPLPWGPAPPGQLHWLTAPIWKSPGPLTEIQSP